MIITSSVIKNSVCNVAFLSCTDPYQPKRNFDSSISKPVKDLPSDLCLSVEGAFAFCTLVILTILQTHMPAISSNFKNLRFQCSTRRIIATIDRPLRSQRRRECALRLRLKSFTISELEWGYPLSKTHAWILSKNLSLADQVFHPKHLCRQCLRQLVDVCYSQRRHRLLESLHSHKVFGMGIW